MDYIEEIQNLKKLTNEFAESTFVPSKSSIQKVIRKFRSELDRIEKKTNNSQASEKVPDLLKSATPTDDPFFNRAFFTQADR